ncbi:hypothetical protein [Halalkalicoccus tibetensis]|uniref:Carboxypeptidase regulatory-like domain-containing protein n=1 Tax=Halalkalicoccus tibetensis TaxID=175632 RepID=A0ABD5V9Q7_9EURY
MVRSKRHAVLTVLVCLTVLLAGCSGWGTDGPVDEEAESNGSDDLEEADAEADDDGTADGSDDVGADGADDADTDDGELPESGTDDEDSDVTDDETDAPEGDSDGETGADDGDDASVDDGDAEEGDEADEGEGDGTDGDEADDADGGDADENDGSTLTVETADVVTDEPVDADVISLAQDGETVDEASGESATFEGLADGEYDLELHDSFGDWAYGDTITIDGEDATHVAEIDQGHTYWPGVEVTIVDGDGEPVEGEMVTIDGEEFVTGPDGTVEEEIESSYTDEREFVVEYGEQSETVETDWETWDGEPETVTFETEDGDADGDAALAIAA